MIPVAIFLFLTGAVLAWRFRVWILVPFSLIAIIVTLSVQLSLGTSLSTACGYGLLLGLAPQLGYVFGMMAQSLLRARFAQQSPSRKASVVLLYRKASTDQRR